MFDYCAVLIAVIMGLALIHPLRGLAKLIQMRDQVKAYWVHVLWTFNVIFWVVVIWLGMFWWRSLQELSFQWYLFLIGYAAVQFLWAAILYPPEFSGRFDFEQHFYANRRWFFGVQLAVVLLDIPETLVKGAKHLRPVPAEYPYLISVLFVICVVALLTSKRRIHAALCVAWAFITLAYMLYEPLMAKIVGH